MDVRPLASGDAVVIAGWRYPGRYATYDIDDPPALARDHWAVIDAEDLIGYCCFGAPARVPGAAAAAGTLDVGYGLAPALMGQGLGERFATAILDFAREHYDSERFRLYVLDWNARSRRLARRLGFVEDSVLQSGECCFVVMVRAVCDLPAAASRRAGRPLR
jgi:[ribosomal protein S18]-alanine N-acetyltransferase